MDERRPVGRGAGQTIRVFVSSTFRDMHAERDVLNRVVFPELRRRCQARGAEFVGLDMRWGVSEDEVHRDGTLAICLREIERSRPFFVCFLGDRFGSVYPPDEVPTALYEAAHGVEAVRSVVEQWYRLDETVERPVYRLRRERGRTMSDEDATAIVRFWESQGLAGAGDSLTAHEVLRGVLEADAPPAHALFYLRAARIARDPAFPQAFVPLFVETDDARAHKLDALKTRIHGSRDRVVVRDYDTHYAGLTIDAAFLPTDLSPEDRAALDDGVVTPAEWPLVTAPVREAIERHGTVALTGMDAFAERVLADLWRAIEPELERPALLDTHQRERAYHERFVTRHTAFFRGRETERARVVSYVENRDDREVLVVTGDPGSGKSAFMAECVRVCRDRHPEALIIPHFIGATPDSASLPATLRSLCETLRREVGLDEAVAEDPDKLRFQLHAFLEQAGTRRPVMLLLDALNQLDPSGRSHELDWLPVWAPPGTRIVVSTLAGDSLDQLTRRVPRDHVIVIQALPVDERRTLIADFLARRRKQLTTDQLDALLDVNTRRDAGLPLYTLVALEELCLFGEYGALQQRIASLPPTLPELFEQVLARLEHDHTRGTVEAVCAWLAVARAGLIESEVLDLLGRGDTFPRIKWTRLYRALEPYLRPIDEDSGGDAAGHIDFYHDQLRFAVSRRYLHMATADAHATDDYRTAHRQLAHYFHSISYDEALPDKWRLDRRRGLSELPFHQTCAEMWDEMERTLSDLTFIAAKCAIGLIADLGSDYDRVTGRAVTDHPPIKTACLWKGRIGLRCPFCSASFPVDREHLGSVVRCAFCKQETRLNTFLVSMRWSPSGPGLESQRHDTGTVISRLASGAVSEFAACVRQHTQELSDNPSLVFSIAANQPDDTAPFQHAVLDSGSPLHSRPWLRWTNKSSAARCALMLPHSTAAVSCGYSPDGTRIVSGHTNGQIVVWNAASGAPIRAFRASAGSVRCCYTHDGRYIVSADVDGGDGIIKIWSARSGALHESINGFRNVVDLSTSHDDKLLAIISDTSIVLTDICTGKPLLERSIRMTTKAARMAGWAAPPAGSCEFSADDTLVSFATLGARRPLRTFDLTTLRERPE